MRLRFFRSRRTKGFSTLKPLKPLNTLAMALVLVLISASRGECDQYADYGIQLYNQHKYDDARKYFDQSLKLSPKNDTVHYYKASCFELSGNLNDAQAEYQFVISNSGNAKLIALAKTALGRVDSQLKAKNDASGSSGSSGSSSNSGSSASASVSATSASNNSNATNKSVAGRSSASGRSVAAATRSSKSGTDGSVSEDDDGLSANSSLEAAMAEYHKVKTDPTDVVPNETRVYFTTSGNNDIYIDSQINGRDFKFILDTGAYSTMVGKNQLAQLGIKPPTGPATTSIGGVGGTRLPAWIMPLQIKLGGLKRTVKAFVPETWESPPLLGQDFFADLEYEFDNRGHCVYFRKSKPLTAAERSMYCIPFRRVGRHLAVDVEGDGGKKTGMLVDTGADGIAFTMVNAKDLGMDIPADAQRVRSQGVGGTSDGLSFTVDSLRLGPIIQRNVRIVVTTSEDGMLGTRNGRYGLLGQGFFGDWRFTVDNANNFLRFFH
jgi:predicted aspartyl protease